MPIVRCLAGETALDVEFKSEGIALSHAANTVEASEPDCASTGLRPCYFVPPAVASVAAPAAVALSAVSKLA